MGNVRRTLAFLKFFVYNASISSERKICMTKILGLIIIVASFIFVLKAPDKSLMDRLLEIKRTKMPQEAEESQKEPKDSDLM